MHSTKLLASLLLLASTASAQGYLNPTKAPAASRNAGTLHVTTGTWTRASAGTANLGPDVIYNNSASSGYFSTFGMEQASGDWSLIDEGRVPTSDSSIMGSSPVTADEYKVDGLTFEYCSDVVGPNVGITFIVYDSYAPCDRILTAPTQPFNIAGTVAASGLPGGSASAAACWVITLDLSGGGEFCMTGDGGPAFPGEDLDLDQDSFGTQFTFNGVFGTNTGPMLAGDPDWSASVPGAQLHGGGGTYYYAAGGACAAATGLEIQDATLVDGPNTPIGTGCYFFGGYKNTNGCGGPSNRPMSSLALTLFADNSASADCSGDPLLFCSPAGINSTGQSVNLAVSPSPSAGSGFHFDATGGPPGFFGFFLVSSSLMSGVAIGDGELCLAAPQGRYNPASGGSLNSVGQFDAAGALVNLAGTGGPSGMGFDVPLELPPSLTGSIQVGSTWYFQLWYRDANPTITSNFSSGGALQF